MAGYIGKLSIDNATAIPVGSTLYGVCNTAIDTAAKVVALTDTTLGATFDTLLDGVTVHIKFANGNSVTSGITLKIGSTDAKVVQNPGGSFLWPADAIISFTYDGTYWFANDAISAEITASDAYDGTSSNPISGKGVKAALQTLDGNITGTPGAAKTITAFDETDGVVSATFADISIPTTQVTGLGAAAVKGVDSSVTDNSTSTNLPTTQAVASYIEGKVSGLTGAMHFVGEVQTLPDATISTTFDAYEAGDVILVGDKEYVYNKKASAATSEWILLGDEGSYALKTRTASVVKTATLTKNTLPQLTITPVSVPNVTSAGTAPSLGTNDVTIPNVTSAGSAATFSVAAGVLSITSGSAPTLGNNITVKEVATWDAGSATTLGTAINVGSASGWDAGSQADLSTDAQTVVIP